MASYVFKRLIRSLFSLIAVIFIIMLLVFQLMNRDQIFKGDAGIAKHTQINDRTQYKYERFEQYGYLDLVLYSDFVQDYAAKNGINPEDAKDLPEDPIDDDSTVVTKLFKETYKKKGYKILRAAKSTEKDINLCLAYKDRNVFLRLWDFFSHIFDIDHVNYVKVSDDYKAQFGNIKREIYFAKDPINGLPCIMGSGTKHKYLFYFDNVFPFVHQNFITLNLGFRYSNGEDFFSYFTSSQGEMQKRETKMPDGSVVYNGYNYHERVFNTNTTVEEYSTFKDGYSKVPSSAIYTNGLSMIGYSFIIGIISTILVYIIGVPLGLILALKKDKIADKIGNLYIIFIMAVPSLAYIYIFAFLGGKFFGLPTNWPTGTMPLVFILPIISLALPSIASLMKWTRRYMIDQMTADYVKFARSQGFSEPEIFRKHILKNALIPIVQGIPGSILGALTGAIITERVYNVPGMGKLLTDAIDAHDNGVIIGISFFYALLSIVSLILGDILMAKIDPRISFSSGGGRK